MTTLSIKLRRSLVAGLLAGLSMTGRSPCLLAAASCQSASASHTAKVCCCKGQCGPRCGMTCCQTPIPKQDRSSAPPKLADEFAPTWGLAPTDAAQVDAPTAADARHGMLHDGAWTATPLTLLAMGIRFNA